MKYCTYAIFLLLVFAGCTQQQACDSEKSVVSTMAAGIGALASCQSTSALSAKIDAIVLKVVPNICPVQGQIIGTLACAPLVDALAAGVLSQLPAEDHCSGGVSLEALKAKALAVCQSVLPALRK